MPQFSEKDCVLRERIYYSDTDAGGVVYYANYLTYFEKARTEWLRRLSIDVAALAAEGTLFVVSSVTVDYRSPARYADILKVYVALAKLSPVRMHFDYRIVREGTDALICEGQTVMVCINKEFKPAAIPEALMSVLQ